MRRPSVTSRSPCRATVAATRPTFKRLSTFPRRSSGGSTCESREVDVREALPLARALVGDYANAVHRAAGGEVAVQLVGRRVVVYLAHVY